MANTCPHILKGRSISKNYGGLQALLNVDFEVADGMIFAIIGPNGAGKTTLFNLISGFDRDYSGEFIFEDVSLGQFPPHDITLRGIARTFQNVRLFKNLTALENVAFPLLFAGVTKKERIKRAGKMLDMVGLYPRKDHRPAELSGGEQQRAAIARALINQPKILLADEPTGNLDSKTSRQIVQTLSELNKKQGLTVIMISHEESLLDEFADDIIHLQDGRVIQEERIR